MAIHHSYGETFKRAPVWCREHQRYEALEDNLAESFAAAYAEITIEDWRRVFGRPQTALR